MEKKSYTVAIDLGSSNVVVAVGSKREDGTLGIEAVVSKPVEGVKAGRIDNIEQAGNAIREAVAEAFGLRRLMPAFRASSSVVPAIPTTSLPTIPRTG